MQAKREREMDLTPCKLASIKLHSIRTVSSPTAFLCFHQMLDVKFLECSYVGLDYAGCMLAG